MTSQVPALYSGDPEFKSRQRTSADLRFFMFFLSFLQVNGCVVSQTRLLTLPFSSLRIRTWISYHSMLCLMWLIEVPTTLRAGRPRVRLPLGSLRLFIDFILPVALWPWVDSACSQNEYQGYFMEGVKAAGDYG